MAKSIVEQAISKVTAIIDALYESYKKNVGRFKKEDTSYDPFSKLNKTTVLQEVRISFNESPVNVQRCIVALTKLLYLLNQGEILSHDEAVDAFVGITKLFSVNNGRLRCLVYLGIKELAGHAQDVSFVVTAPLIRDIGGNEVFRGQAIRALSAVVDSSTIPNVKRYIEEAIVHDKPTVKSAGLVSSVHLLRKAPEMVRQWVNKVKAALGVSDEMVQYHALGLLYEIFKSNKLGVKRVLSIHVPVVFQFGHVILVRVVRKLIDKAEGRGEDIAPLIDWLRAGLAGDASRMVNLEASRVILHMPNAGSAELNKAISVLRKMCCSDATLRFAAVRTLSNGAAIHLTAVARCEEDLLGMISSSNDSTSTMALTTLLKISTEEAIGNLLAVALSHVFCIKDDSMKVEVVGAIRSAGLKYPSKHGAIFNIFRKMGFEKGGFEYKTSLVEAILAIAKANEDITEVGLDMLCEFLENWEHSSLTGSIISTLARYGPQSTIPSQCIRHIYNRYLLEPSEVVRASVVSALASFGAECNELRCDVLVLLDLCQLDDDDEVRDRAVYYQWLLSQDAELIESYILKKLQVSPVALEQALKQYLSRSTERAFELDSVAFSEEDCREAVTTTDDVTAHVDYETLRAVPQLEAFGPLFKSCDPMALTEEDTDYTVRCIKYVYNRHVVLQFECTNAMDDRVLENVYVAVDPPEAFEIVAVVPCDQLKFNEPGSCFVALALPESLHSSTGFLVATLHSTVKECDPATGRAVSEIVYNDEYQLEDVFFSAFDSVRGFVRDSFEATWEEIGNDYEMKQEFVLTDEILPLAVEHAISYTGLQPCDGSDRVPEGSTSHSLLLSGVFRGGADVLIRSQFVRSAKGNEVMRLTVRSNDPEVSEFIVNAID